MTPPKKWFLQFANTDPDRQESSSSDCSQRDLVLVNNDGLMKKPKVSVPLGNVQNVSSYISNSCTYSLAWPDRFFVVAGKGRSGFGSVK